MRRRSITGPLLLLAIGGVFLWRNLHPETPVFDLLALYWPFLLIGWGVLRLVETAILHRRGWVAFTGGEVVLVVLICIAGSGLWEAHRHGVHFNPAGLDVFGEQYDYPVSATAPATGLVRVTFDNPRGNIKVTGSDTQEITVTGHKTIRAWGRQDAERTDKNTPLELVPQGDHLLIRTNQDRAPDNQRVADDLEVMVPRGVAVEAHGRSNDFEVTDVNANVELSSDRADARLSRVSGNVRLDIGRSDLIRATDVKGTIDLQGSRGSDVDMENVEGQVTITGAYTGTLEFKNLAKPLQFEGSRNTELHAQAVPGRISMDLSELNASGLVGPVRLVTGSRDIKLEKFTQSLQLETDRGDIQLQPSLPMPSIDARSGVGRIDLIVPNQATFDLQATAERGEAYNGFGPPIHQERDGRTATLKGRVGDGPSIRLTANRGTVAVRREGSDPGDIPDSDDGNPPNPPKPPRPAKVPKEFGRYRNQDVTLPPTKRPATTGSPGPSLAVLFLVNVLNIYDRQALGAVLEPLRHEFHLNDTQLGALPAIFTVIYAIAGLPLGRLADRISRKWLLAAGMAVWAALTGLGGLAVNYAMLLATRLGVGIGEAVCAPVAVSWIGDLVAESKRARAMAVFMVAVPVGVMLSFAISGPVAQAHGWRIAMAIAAVPAVALIPAVLWLREPERGKHSPARRGDAGNSIWSLLRIRALWWIAISGAILNFTLYTFSTFVSAFLTRVHGMTVGSAGIWAGVGSGVAGILGAAAAGSWGDRGGGAWKMRLAAGASLAATPVAVVALRMPPGTAAGTVLLLMTAYGLLQMYYTLVYATIQDIVPATQRGTAMAGYFMVMYLSGGAFGPLVTGRLSDYFAHGTSEVARAQGLHQAMYIIPVLSAALAVVLWAAARKIRQPAAL